MTSPDQKIESRDKVNDNLNEIKQPTDFITKIIEKMQKIPHKLKENFLFVFFESKLIKINVKDVSSQFDELICNPANVIFWAKGVVCFDLDGDVLVYADKSNVVHIVEFSCDIAKLGNQENKGENEIKNIQNGEAVKTGKHLNEFGTENVKNTNKLVSKNGKGMSGNADNVGSNDAVKSRFSFHWHSNRILDIFLNDSIFVVGNQTVLKFSFLGNKKVLFGFEGQYLGMDVFEKNIVLRSDKKVYTFCRLTNSLVE